MSVYIDTDVGNRWVDNVGPTPEDAFTKSDLKRKWATLVSVAAFTFDECDALLYRSDCSYFGPKVGRFLRVFPAGTRPGRNRWGDLPGVFSSVKVDR